MNKMIIISVLFGFLFLGCAPQKGELFPGSQTNEFDYILDQLNADMTELGYEQFVFYKATIRIGDISHINEDALGICFVRQKTQDGVTNITLAPNKTPEEYTIALYHEIGHCYMGLGHDSDEAALMAHDYNKTQVYNDFFSSDEKRLELLQEMLDKAGFEKKKTAEEPAQPEVQ